MSTKTGNSGQIKFLGTIIIKGKIKAETGLLIGGLSEEIRIAKIDSTIIRDPITNMPVIPGSTLKGKMRSLLEYFHDKVGENGNVHNCDNPNCDICRPFGSSEEKEAKNPWGPTRLIVRDALLDEETKKQLERFGYHDYVELKGENVINRLTSQATPRFFERVPRGSKFDFEMDYLVFSVGNDNGKTDVEKLKQVFLAMSLLEDAGIGGSVSRGYGKISFQISGLTLRLSGYYEGDDGKELNLLEVLQHNPSESKAASEDNSKDNQGESISTKEEEFRSVSPRDLLKQFEELKGKIMMELERIK